MKHLIFIEKNYLKGFLFTQKSEEGKPDFITVSDTPFECDQFDFKSDALAKARQLIDLGWTVLHMQAF